MNHAITMGIFWHLIGAASAACFYAPFKQVKQWSMGNHVVNRRDCLLADSSLGLSARCCCLISGPITVPSTPPRCCRCFLFGAMWGIGNINYGLTMRYLGMSMGIGIAIGITPDCRYADDPDYQRADRCAAAYPGWPDDAARRAGCGDWRGDSHPRRPAERAQDGH
ncbi:L-rhamnose-H(+) transport protein [Raoultella planticola]|uniref:L-rhamnose-H(+) transport protein n=1 Tax=Raoultella planticola TaxID=575 RepID=A0A485BEV0_RAOPL|nr:L-rhamnose-H(+) transport protein [Raoultella planticola]